MKQTVYIKVEKDTDYGLEIWGGEGWNQNGNLEKAVRFVFTEEELLQHDKKIAENAFDAGVGAGYMANSLGIKMADTNPAKTEYINTIINPKQ